MIYPDVDEFQGSEQFQVACEIASLCRASAQVPWYPTLWLSQPHHWQIAFEFLFSSVFTWIDKEVERCRKRFKSVSTSETD